ncbi:MAG: DNA translocase FtsK 4TM domain-containing protein [Candidatus Zixiibacteriota bacterium]
MTKKSGKRASRRKWQVLGILFLLLAVFTLIALISHSHLDDKRITDEADPYLSPFKIQYHNQGGMLGAYLSFFLFLLLGWLSYFVPVGFLSLSLLLFSPAGKAYLKMNVFILFVMALLVTMLYNIHQVVERGLLPDTGAAGGYVSEQLTLLSIRLVGEIGSYLVLSAGLLMLFILYTSTIPFLPQKLTFSPVKFPTRWFETLSKILRSLISFRWNRLLMMWRKGKKQAVRDGSQDDLTAREAAVRERQGMDTEAGLAEIASPSGNIGKRKTTLVKSAEPLQIKSVGYTYPTLELLKDSPRSGSTVNNEELAGTARQLKETLNTFGVSIEGSIEHFPGPVITLYEFKPGTGVKVNQIVNLSDDLALALKAKRIRIIAPIPGKAAVGVEIPNRHPQIVYLKDVLKSSAFASQELRLPLALGKTTSGQPYVVDLTRLPHLLIAGATGSGKSVCINVLITSLLYRLHPHQVRFILIDPKMLELTVYRGIPHLGRPVVTSPKRAEKILAEAVVEMESRYRKLAEASVRNIEDYNAKQKEPEKQLPYIIIFVDELADLLMSSTSTRMELLITRLAQMARAVGIHLVLATQRPSVDVITGLIKANFPARLAFQVSSKVDSRTIIDANGAEKLLGRGDMLFLHPGQPEPRRIHGAFISSAETEAVVKFIKDQGLEMFALESISPTAGEGVESGMDFGDPLFREACEVVIRHKQGSVSLLQRRLGVGYQRAARLIDKLEEAGIVSPFDGSKAREVMVDKSYIDALFSKSAASQTPEPE